jgi:Tat protein secretion system quality control protein TatD with DNase activity
MLVDTHAHNQWASFGKDREKVISRARIVDVKYIVNIGFERALHFYVPNQ